MRRVGSRRSKRLCWAAAASLGVAVLWPARITPQGHSKEILFTTTHHAMGTEFALYLYSADAGRAASISDEVFGEVDRLDGMLSNYNERSELSRINREAAQGSLTTDPETFAFLEQAQHWSEVSHGAFDMTVGRLMKTWGFYEHAGRVPSAEELAHLRAMTGWEKVRLNESDHTVRFLAEGVELDPGGIGKGFAVDAAVRFLRSANVSAAMISAGGSTIYGLGAPPHEPGWKVVVRGPVPSQATLSIVFLRDLSLSSSDCTQKHFEAGGQMYCHIMDPRTLEPVRDRIQVSILDASATASDALSNVLFVEPPESSRRILEQSAPQARALIVSRDGAKVRCAFVHWQVHVEPACSINE